MSDYVPPIFLVSDDVRSFDSIELMVRCVEPWDVTEDVRAFDSTGRRLRIRGTGVRRTRWTVGGGETWVDFDASGEPAADELADVLRDYVDRLVKHLGEERVGLSATAAATLRLDQLVPAISRWTHTR